MTRRGRVGRWSSFADLVSFHSALADEVRAVPNDFTALLPFSVPFLRS